MKERKQVKVAMVGTGFAANIHAEAYEQVPGVDVQVVAVASKLPDQAKAFCKKYHIDPGVIYDDADKMINEVDADVIDLVVPTFLHVPYAIKAANAGKSVICEKPLTGYFGDLSVPIEKRENVGLTDKKKMLAECLNTCKDIEEAIKKTGITFAYAENWVYARPIWKAKNILQKTKGKILEIRCGESHSGSHSQFAAEWKYTGGGALIRKEMEIYS